MTDSVPFDPGAVGSRSTPKQVSWSSRDCMLYALGIGAGTGDLQYTTNNTKGVDQKMVPTMPVTLGVDFGVLSQAGKFDWAKVLHAEQRVELLAEIPVKGQAEAVTEIIEMWDKGKAALVVARTAAPRWTANRCGAVKRVCSFEVSAGGVVSAVRLRRRPCPTSPTAPPRPSVTRPARNRRSSTDCRATTTHFTAIPMSPKRPASIGRFCMGYALTERSGTRSCERSAITIRFG